MNTPLRDATIFGEGILDTAIRIERERPLTDAENIELALAWADAVGGMKRLVAACHGAAAVLGRWRDALTPI